jgi:hypothetical protein
MEFQWSFQCTGDRVFVNDYHYGKESNLRRWTVRKNLRRPSKSPLDQMATGQMLTIATLSPSGEGKNSQLPSYVQVDAQLTSHIAARRRTWRPSTYGASAARRDSVASPMTSGGWSRNQLLTAPILVV